MEKINILLVQVKRKAVNPEIEEKKEEIAF